MKKKLSNPFVLVAEGFGLGALLFFATMTPDSDSQPQPQQARAAEGAISLDA